MNTACLSVLVPKMESRTIQRSYGGATRSDRRRFWFGPMAAPLARAGSITTPAWKTLCLLIWADLDRALYPRLNWLKLKGTGIDLAGLEAARTRGCPAIRP